MATLAVTPPWSAVVVGGGWNGRSPSWHHHVKFNAPAPRSVNGTKRRNRGKRPPHLTSPLRLLLSRCLPHRVLLQSPKDDTSSLNITPTNFAPFFVKEKVWQHVCLQLQTCERLSELVEYFLSTLTRVCPQYPCGRLPQLRCPPTANLLAQKLSE